MVNGNLLYVQAKTYISAEKKIFRREMRRVGRCKITDWQVKVGGIWTKSSE